MKRKYIYGKSHYLKYPYKKRIHEACTKYINKARQLSRDYRFNNLIVDLRNEMCEIIAEIYQQMSIELKYNIKIRPTIRRITILPNRIEKQKCVICGEQRTVDRCHIIPRENSGSNSENNMIYLCPTHHFLFDQGKLSREEFNKIKIHGKAKDSIEFFNKTHKIKHQKYWSLQNKLYER